MVTKKNNLKYGLRALPRPSPQLIPEKDILVKRVWVPESRFKQQLGDEVDKFIEDSMLSNLHDHNIAPIFLEKLKKELLLHYCSREFYHCRLIRKTIENVLHSLHKEGQITLKEIVEYTGGIVRIAYESPDSDPRPWNPAHEIGNILWTQIFKMCSVVFNGESYDDMQCVLRALENTGFLETMELLNTREFKAHQSFLIEPGESLDLTQVSEIV